MNFGKMMKQVQQAQAKMAAVQEELKDETVEASAGGGMVRVVMSGDLQVREISIDPAAVDPDDIELLQDMVTAAVNEALRAAQELASQKMAAVTGGINIPGLT
ncbi:MAG: YbaB/EbfC family nucleoid-associated protein [Actinobacteria bacterium]|nr:MAG: YbaB/EbfC family nucleoid-associated protein [Actinomycetota bacterium]